jgi:integrase
VGREYLDRTPFRRGTETLIRKLREDNRRRRRISEDEEARLLAVAPPLLRSMLITALDTGTRQGEMLALRFGDIDFARGLITLRGETTKSKKTRLVPIATARLRASCRIFQIRRQSRWAVVPRLPGWHGRLRRSSEPRLDVFESTLSKNAAQRMRAQIPTSSTSRNAQPPFQLGILTTRRPTMVDATAYARTGHGCAIRVSRTDRL